jgi:methionyl-tRNA synthetase
MKGVESHGMLLAADYKNAEGKDCVEVLTAPWAQPGTKVILEGADESFKKPDEITADDFFSVEIKVTDKVVAINGIKLIADGKNLTTEFAVNSSVN